MSSSFTSKVNQIFAERGAPPPCFLEQVSADWLNSVSDGVLFVYATWSAPAWLVLKTLAQAVGKVTDPPTIFIANHDATPIDALVDTLGAHVTGNGETFSIIQGKIRDNIASYGGRTQRILEFLRAHKDSASGGSASASAVGRDSASTGTTDRKAAMSTRVPDYLESTVSMLESAYPNGIPDADVLPVMRALYDHMSDRNLAETMGIMLGQDYALLLHRVYEAAQMDESSAPVQVVVRLLERHGYTDWYDED